MKSGRLDPRTFARRTWASSGGQGIVEYILLIVIILSVALAVSSALFKPFEKWARNYIGEYIYCLLDEAELPTLGGDGTVSECSSQFESYSFAEGRPPKSGGGGSEDGDSSSSSDKGSRDRLRRARNNSGDTAGGGPSSSRGRRSAMNLGEGFDNGAGQGRNRPTDVSGQFANNKNSRTSFGRSYSYEVRPQGSRYVGITGYLAQEAEKIKKRDEKVRSVGKVAETARGYSRGRGRLPTSEVKTQKAKDVDFGNVDWSYGDMFRMILIIAIIIVLVLFVGGQIMQISKSMEKGE